MSETTPPRAVPFVKWVGGKRQLLPVINQNLPHDFDTSIKPYVEPFLGGGAVLFSILERDHSLDNVYVSDYNLELITAYQSVRDTPGQVMDSLTELSAQYNLVGDIDKKKTLFLSKRAEYNALVTNQKKTQSPYPENDAVRVSGLFIFLNKAGFNGLYRVNKKGECNTPFGYRENLSLFSKENIERVSELLKPVRITQGSYETSGETVTGGDSFIYVDPPYRPITKTASFTKYTTSVFNDTAQRELIRFLKAQADVKGAKVMFSNSDPHNEDPADDFFDDQLSSWGTVHRVNALRRVNSDAAGRGVKKEILFTNY